MAEKETVKQETKQAAAKETVVPDKIQFVGAKTGGAYTATYTHRPTAPSKPAVVFVENEVLEVGKDVTQEEAKRLLADKYFNFKEVK